MNFRQLEIFYAIMTTGTITAAARQLNLTQPAVTKTLAHAEDKLKFPLFHRIKGRLVPTDNALAIMPDIERLFDEMRTLHQTLDDVRNSRTGSLSIVAIPTLGQVAIPKAIAAFAAERPNVRISFEVRPKRTVMQSVATQRAEVGFAYLTPAHANVRKEPLCSDNLVCIVPSDHPLAGKGTVTAGDLEGHRVIRYGKEQGIQALLDNALFDGGLQTVTSNIETVWVSTAWALVASGAGIALVDNFSHLERLFPNVAVLKFRPSIKVVANILVPRQKPLSRTAQDFVEVARRILSDDASLR